MIWISIQQTYTVLVFVQFVHHIICTALMHSCLPYQWWWCYSDPFPRDRGEEEFHGDPTAGPHQSTNVECVKPNLGLQRGSEAGQSEEDDYDLVEGTVPYECDTSSAILVTLQARHNMKIEIILWRKSFLPVNCKIKISWTVKKSLQPNTESKNIGNRKDEVCNPCSLNSKAF